MANTALNRTTQALLTNKSGGNLAYGDVVVLDNTNANGFTTTTSAGLSTRGLGVILEPSGIANNASGMVAVGGWCPKVNLNTAAVVGQFIKTHTVAGQGTPHASPQVEGDFAVALSASATPPCNLFGSPNGPLAGGAGTVTNTGTLTSGKAIIGNGSADVTVSAASGVAHLASGALTGSNVLLASEVTGVLPGANGGGMVLLEQHAASTSSSLDFTTAISSTYDTYQFEFISIVPTTNAVNLLMRMNTGSGFDSGANYSYVDFRWNTGATAAGGNTAQTAIALNNPIDGIANTAAWGLMGTLRLFVGNGSSTYPRIWSDCSLLTGSTREAITTRGAYEVTTALTQVQFLMSGGGTIASGTIRCYGLAK